MIILLVLAAAVVGAPIVAAVLVSLASRREDARHSLAGKAPSWVTWPPAACSSVPSSEGRPPRRFRSLPRPRAPRGRGDLKLADRPARVPTAARLLATAGAGLRCRHACSIVPDPGQLDPGGQSRASQCRRGRGSRPRRQASRYFRKARTPGSPPTCARLPSLSTDPSVPAWPTSRGPPAWRWQPGFFEAGARRPGVQHRCRIRE